MSSGAASFSGVLPAPAPNDVLGCRCAHALAMLLPLLSRPHVEGLRVCISSHLGFFPRVQFPAVSRSVAQHHGHLPSCLDDGRPTSPLASGSSPTFTFASSSSSPPRNDTLTEEDENAQVEEAAITRALHNCNA